MGKAYIRYKSERLEQNPLMELVTGFIPDQGLQVPYCLRNPENEFLIIMELLGSHEKMRLEIIIVT